MEDYVGAKFYCTHALADGNQRIQIREKTLRHAGSKTLHQQNRPVLNWRCRLARVDLYNGRDTVVVVMQKNCWGTSGTDILT